MAHSTDPDLAAKLAADVVVAYLARNSPEPRQLLSLITELIATFGGQRASETSAYAPEVEDDGVVVGFPEPERAAPARTPTNWADTISQDHIICLEDGKPFRSLRRHLKAKYNLTPEAYREKWGLPPDYPMVAPSYARERSEVAKRIGLGKSPPVAAQPAPKAARVQRSLQGRLRQAR